MIGGYLGGYPPAQLDLRYGVTILCFLADGGLAFPHLVAFWLELRWKSMAGRENYLLQPS
jgi:hypothetical protein